VITSGVAYSVYFGAWGAWAPYWPVYFSTLGVGLAAVGVLSAIPALVQIVAAPAWGMAADRLGDVRLPIASGGLIAILVAAFLATGPSPAWLFLGVALLAAGTSAWAPLLDARTVSALGKHRDRYGQARGIGTIGFIVASVVVGILVTAHGPRVLFAAYIPLVAIAIVWVVTLFARTGTRQRVAGVGPLGAVRLLRDRSMALVFLGSILAWMGTNGATTFFSLRLVAQGADAGLVGIGWAVNAAVEVPMMIVFGRLAKRTGIPALIATGAAILAVRNLGWALASSDMATVAVALLSGVGFSFLLVGITSWLAGRVPSSLRATSQALFLGTAYAIGSIAGSLGAGWIANSISLDAMYYAATVVAALSAVIIWLGLGTPGWKRGRATPA
jgi:MFS transporter, PPP family, 3-phenylpropionic acid transporter